MAEDLLAIINVFNCRVNGRRKYKRQKGESPTDNKSGCEQINTGGVKDDS
jgi:hypothetical protein